MPTCRGHGIPRTGVPERSRNGTTPTAKLLASATRSAGSTEIIFLIPQPVEIICYNKYLPRKPGGFSNKAGFAHRLPGLGTGLISWGSSGSTFRLCEHSQHQEPLWAGSHSPPLQLSATKNSLLIRVGRPWHSLPRERLWTPNP